MWRVCSGYQGWHVELFHLSIFHWTIFTKPQKRQDGLDAFLSDMLLEVASHYLHAQRSQARRLGKGWSKFYFAKKSVVHRCELQEGIEKFALWGCENPWDAHNSGPTWPPHSPYRHVKTCKNQREERDWGTRFYIFYIFLLCCLWFCDVGDATKVCTSWAAGWGWNSWSPPCRNRCRWANGAERKGWQHFERRRDWNGLGRTSVPGCWHHCVRDLHTFACSWFVPHHHNNGQQRVRNLFDQWPNSSPCRGLNIHVINCHSGIFRQGIWTKNHPRVRAFREAANDALVVAELPGWHEMKPFFGTWQDFGCVAKCCLWRHCMGGDRSSRRCRRWLFQANPTHLAGHLLRSPHKTRSQRRIQGQGAALVLIIFDPYFLDFLGAVAAVCRFCSQEWEDWDDHCGDDLRWVGICRNRVQYRLLGLVAKKLEMH